MKSVLAILLGVLIALPLGACASSAVTTVKVSAADNKAPRTRRIPRSESDEFLRSWGVRAVGAEAAYLRGATGKGVTIALIDTGVPRGAADISVSKASVDLIGERPKEDPAIQARHARSVAGPLVSVLNGRGTLGLAYDATLLSVRADMVGGCAAQCALRTADVARGLDYAVAQGARIIILPLVSPTPDKPLSAPFEAALQRAVDAGALLVIAGGNSGRPDPAWPARYAAEPRFKGQIIAVGATNMAGDLAPWSVKAGAAKDAFLAAPGQQIVTNCDDKSCLLVSGTSFSAPYVAGAAALLMDAYPSLTAREAAALLLRSGRDLGEPGCDAIYGCGVLDVAAALRSGEARTAQGVAGSS